MSQLNMNQNETNGKRKESERIYHSSFRHFVECSENVSVTSGQALCIRQLTVALFSKNPDFSNLTSILVHATQHWHHDEFAGMVSTWFIAGYPRSSMSRAFDNRLGRHQR